MASRKTIVSNGSVCIINRLVVLLHVLLLGSMLLLIETTHVDDIPCSCRVILPSTPNHRIPRCANDTAERHRFRCCARTTDNTTPYHPWANVSLSPGIGWQQQETSTCSNVWAATMGFSPSYFTCPARATYEAAVAFCSGVQTELQAMYDMDNAQKIIAVYVCNANEHLDACSSTSLKKRNCGNNERYFWSSTCGENGLEEALEAYPYTRPTHTPIVKKKNHRNGHRNNTKIADTGEGEQITSGNSGNSLKLSVIAVSVVLVLTLGVVLAGLVHHRVKRHQPKDDIVIDLDGLNYNVDTLEVMYIETVDASSTEDTHVTWGQTSGFVLPKARENQLCTSTIKNPNLTKMNFRDSVADVFDQGLNSKR
eukprot:m.13106 g.13106  ORF g.13106 m.13106 type:complete len:367 (-) comp9597_c0_seq1:225-1325(-)